MSDTPELGPLDIITDVCRISFPALFEPKATSKGGDVFKYQAVVLLPPETDLKPYVACLKAAMLARWETIVKLKPGKNPIKDCAEKEEIDGYDEGWHFLNVSSKYQPQVINAKKQEVLDPGTVRAGYWCRFHLKAYAWENEKGGKGVSFGLEAVQFVKKGDPLDGRRSAGEVFGEVEVEADEDIFGGAEDGDAVDELFA